MNPTFQCVHIEACNFIKVKRRTVFDCNSLKSTVAHGFKITTKILFQSRNKAKQNTMYENEKKTVGTSRIKQKNCIFTKKKW